MPGAKAEVLRFSLLVRISLSVTLAVIATMAMQASVSADPPDRPEPGLPTRPAVTEPHSPNEPSTQVDERIGGHIKLSFQTNNENYWTVVQWQGGTGRWYDVEGWRDQFRDDGMVRWWVADQDLNTGPFRWTLYQDEGGILWTSKPFFLPSQSETLELFVPLE